VLTEQKQQQTIDRPPKEPAMPPSENTMPPSDQSHALPPKMQPMIWLDRCIFSSITPIVCIPMTLEAQEEKDQEEHEEGEDKDVVICCVVKVFLQSDRDLLIEVYDPNSCDTWSLAHRDSQELIKDFEKENFMEMQLYLEVMCSTLKLCTHPITKERFLCFEEEEE
jgi:hypothetical protein